MAVLAQYNMGSAVATTVDSNVTAGDLTNDSLVTFAVNESLGYSTDPELLVIAPNGSTNIANAVSNDAMFYFTITPDGGVTMNLTSLTFKVARGGATTPRGYGVGSDIGAYGANIASADVATQRTTWTDVSIDLTGASFQGLTAAITFWIFTYAPNGLSMEYDSITLNGTASASSSSIKTINGLAIASVKTVNGLAIASVKTVNGLA